jgi:hypothetical protein
LLVIVTPATSPKASIDSEPISPRNLNNDALAAAKERIAAAVSYLHGWAGGFRHGNIVKEAVRYDASGNVVLGLPILAALYDNADLRQDESDMALLFTRAAASTYCSIQ